jgi:type II secretory pathway component PulF
MGDDPLQLLITGQKTGQWMEMLDRVTAYYQEEAARATDAAKSAQKRAGVLITLISMGYVTIAVTAGGYNLMFKFADSFGS